MRVVPIDPTVPGAARAWAAVFEAAGRDAYGHLHSAWTPREIQATYRLDTVDTRRIAIAAEVDGSLVGAGECALSLLDNPERADLLLAVLPEHRRRGVGTALLHEVERLAAGAGRDILGTESDVADGRPDPAVGFAARNGYTAEHGELRSDLVLPVEEALLTGLEASAPSGGYELLTSHDGIPDEWLADRAELSRRMSVDIPLGGVVWHEEHWDADRVRRGDRLARAQGRRSVESVARHVESGRLVGYTQLHVSADTPQLAYQWDTLVLPEHRGHRLGMRLKITNLRAMRRALPAVGRVVTWNAADNEPMLRVNRSLGFVRVGRLTEWQKRPQEAAVS